MVAEFQPLTENEQAILVVGSTGVSLAFTKSDSQQSIQVIVATSSPRKTFLPGIKGRTCQHWMGLTLLLVAE